MERFRLTILVESRIRWKVYVRFGGEYWETYHRNMTRRRVLSLHNQVVKAVKTNFGDKRAFVLLRKLEKETVELVIVSRQIVALINEYKDKYLDTHLPGLTWWRKSTGAFRSTGHSPTTGRRWMTGPHV